MATAVLKKAASWQAALAESAVRRRLKLMVTYAGPEGAEAALDELLRAGLPREVDVLFAVPRVMIPRRSARRRPRLFQPSWSVRTEPPPGVRLIGDEALHAAETWDADLIVVGSRGSHALEPRFFSCMSSAVAARATCSVRIARRCVRTGGAMPRILIGVDGSSAAREAARAISERIWPRATEARLVAVSEHLPERWSERFITGIVFSPEGGDPRVRDLSLAVEQAAAELRSAGLTVSTELRGGEPSKGLLEAAREWEADCIVVGASALGQSNSERVPAVLAETAPCSVEVVRARL